MLFITYQCTDYKEYQNSRNKEIKQLLNIPEEKNVYWCIKANNLTQAVINSYCCEPNQPALLVMFETEDYYEIDAAKWNYKVFSDNPDVNTDLLKLEHDYRVEYIVTDIPEKRIEIPFLYNNFVHNLGKSEEPYFEDARNMLSASLGEEGIMNYLRMFPDKDEFQNLTRRSREVNPQFHNVIVTLKTNYAFSVGLILPVIYPAGAIYLTDKVGKYGKYCFNKWKTLVDLSNNSPNSPFNKYKSIEDYEHSWVNYRKLIYQKCFTVDKKMKIYPNDKCICGSGLKYKKCCMNKEVDLDAILNE